MGRRGALPTKVSARSRKMQFYEFLLELFLLFAILLLKIAFPTTVKAVQEETAINAESTHAELYQRLTAGVWVTNVAPTA